MIYLTIHEAAVDAGKSQLADASKLETNSVMGAPVGAVESLDDRRRGHSATKEIARPRRLPVGGLHFALVFQQTQ